MYTYVNMLRDKRARSVTAPNLLYRGRFLEKQSRGFLDDVADAVFTHCVRIVESIVVRYPPPAPPQPHLAPSH